MADSDVVWTTVVIFVLCLLRHDSSSSKTIILWKNENPLHKNDENTCLSSNCIWPPPNRNEYPASQRLSEFYSYLIKKTASDFIDHVIADSLQAVETIKYTGSITNRSSSTNLSREDEYVLRVVNYGQKCINRPITPDYVYLLSKSTWVDENGMFNDQTAVERISEYIKQNWNLNTKYLFTVEKTNTSTISELNCHSFKAEFSVPTKEYPIPQVTVSVFFTVEIAPLFPIVYMKYQLETDRRVYVIGEHSFNKNRFRHLFEWKRNAYLDINRYPGWSSGPGHSRHGLHEP